MVMEMVDYSLMEILTVAVLEMVAIAMGGIYDMNQISCHNNSSLRLPAAAADRSRRRDGER